MPDTFDLSRRKTLAALGTIGAASAGAGLGTSAFFSDQETFENNRLVAGELDVKTGFKTHYSDWSEDELEGIPEGNVTMTGPTAHDGDPGFDEIGPTDAPGLDFAEPEDMEQWLENTTRETVPPGLDDITQVQDEEACDVLLPDNDRLIVEISDLKNSDLIIVSFWIVICDNPGYVWLDGGLVENSENGLTEPERDDPDENGGEPGELPQHIDVWCWYDADGDDIFDPSVDVPIGSGTLAELLDQLTRGHGIPLDGHLATPFDETEDPPSSPARECFNGVEIYCFTWWFHVHGIHDNEIQGDSVTFDLGLYTEQCRHNDGSGMNNAAVPESETDDS